MPVAVAVWLVLVLHRAPADRAALADLTAQVQMAALVV
jgi:hypothetical protein